jgi:diaminopimelate epimerase
MIKFYKYQGAGNDFVIIDNRNNVFIGDKEKLAKQLCERKFGIGSDGLIFIENSDKAKFEMDFLNPDGSRSFCGNGSRCAVRFAKDQKIFVNDKTSFSAIDGIHFANIQGGLVKIEMKNVDNIQQSGSSYFVDTGSPHYVSYFNSVDKLDIIEFGQKIRYSEVYKVVGTNVNVVEELSPMNIKVRTYERGVENETLACGTGVTACALTYGLKNDISSGVIKIHALGGELKVSFIKNVDNSFEQIWLEGPAKFVFKGELNV